MPETPRGEGTAADGPAVDGSAVDGSAVDGSADGRGSLDVPEWVSELRRLYVEPKTRAQLREAGAIVPQKRRRGLPVGRGPRRGAMDPLAAPVAPSAPGAAEDEIAGAAAVTVPVATGALRPAVLEPAGGPEPADRSPLTDESGEPYTPPDRTEEEKVATWLTSYLVATGHAADDEAAGTDPGEPATDASPAVSGAAELTASPDVAHTADDAAPAVPLDVHDPQPVEAIVLDAEPVESHPRSLADLAGLSEFASAPTTREPVPGEAPAEAFAVVEHDASRADELPGEPWRAAHESAGVLVSTGGDAATPNPGATSSPETDVSHPAASLDREPARAADPTLPEDPLEEAPVEHASAPGRPSTVPAVTLSWREAESFEIGVPGVEESERAIVVEPPSQLVAERRSRRRELDGADDVAAVPVAVEPLPASAPVAEAPATRASTRAASGYQSGKRRRAMVVGTVLVMLAIVAWYFLLRGDGQDAATESTAPTSGAHAVVVLSPTVSGRAPATSVA